MTDQASLTQQIEAVEWALLSIDWRSLPDDQIEKMRRSLEAATETLKTLEFARETLR